MKKKYRIPLILFCCAFLSAAWALDEKQIENELEKIKKKLALLEKKQENKSATPDLFSNMKDSFGVDIHGHLQFEYEDYGTEGSRGGDATFDNQYFTLWIGKEINDQLEVAVEIEYEHGGTGEQTGGTGGGGGGETEVDQAMALWKPLDDETFKIRFGKFYVPFGIERFSYAGPYNRLVSRPAPFQNVYPGTYADTGLEFLGKFLLNNDMSFIYNLAWINGLGPDAAVDIREARQGRDNNDNKAIAGRLALKIGKTLEFGGSYYKGKYNEFQSRGHALVPDNELSLIYHGLDARWTQGPWDIRGEWLESYVDTGETLINGFRNFRRSGYYLQTAYRLDFEKELLKFVDLVLRFDSKDENSTIHNTDDTNTWAYGLAFGIYEKMKLKFEFQKVHERGPEKISNGAFLAQMSLQF
jgi:phosphate-selective porin